MSTKRSNSFQIRRRHNQDELLTQILGVDKLSKSFLSFSTKHVNRAKKGKGINENISIETKSNRQTRFKYNTKKYSHEQINILRKIDAREYSAKSLIEELKYLRENCPYIEKFTDEILITKDELQIFEKDEPSDFAQIVNAQNVINIINFLYDIFSDDIDAFISNLSELNIYFSYIKCENTHKAIDCALMCSIPPIIYNHISTNGYKGFKNNKIKSENKSQNIFDEKNSKDLENCYENMISFNLIDKIGINNFENYPTIIYFINENLAQKLISKKIINIPYKDFHINTKKKNQGYQKINMNIKMKNDIHLLMNYNFLSLKGNFIQSIGQKIFLKKGLSYIIVIALNIEDIINNKKSIKYFVTKFIELYNNIPSLKEKININQCQLFLISNNNLINSAEILSKKSDSKFIKKNMNNFFYASPQLGLSTILQLKNNIKNNTLIINKLEAENKEIKNKIKQIEDLKQENKENKEEEYEEEYVNSKEVLRAKTVPNIDTIICELRKGNVDYLEKFDILYSCFSKISNYYKYCKKELLFHKVSPFIGKEIKSQKDKQNWDKIKEILEKKINENKTFKNYYEGLIELLFDTNNSIKKHDINSDCFYGCTIETKIFIQSMLIFTSILEDNLKIKNIEAKYQIALLVKCLYFLGEEKLIKLLNNEISSEGIFKKIICCPKIFNE